MSANFKKVIKGAAKGEIILPLLRSALFNPTFPDFTVDVQGMNTEGDHYSDGLFHPSAHPLWTERQLYYYVKDAEKMIPEPFDPEGSMAVTAGTFWHGFIQNLGIYHGWLVPNDGTHCERCRKNPAEHYAEDLTVGSGGHCDGKIAPNILEDALLEIKTMNPMKIRKLEKLGEMPNEIQPFIELLPDYYAQGLEYDRMLEAERTIVLLINPAYPFTMKELHVPYEPAVARRIRDKYARVRDAAASGEIPEPCCGIGSSDSKTCFARAVCPVGLGIR